MPPTTPPSPSTIDLTAAARPAPPALAPAIAPSTIDLTLSSDDEHDAPARKKAARSAAVEPLPSTPLDFSRCEVIQTAPRPAVVFRDVGGDGLERLCERLVRDASRAFRCAGDDCRGAYRRGPRFASDVAGDLAFCEACAAQIRVGRVSEAPVADGRFGRKGVLGSPGFASMCGAAEKAPGAKDNYQIVADGNSLKVNEKKTILTDADAARWFRAVAGPALRACAAVARRDGARVPAATLGACDGESAAPEGDVRVLRYPATGRSHASFHRHRDHPHYGMVVLASLRATCDFWVTQTSSRPTAETVGRLVTLRHGDLIVFDASREPDGSGFAHGVEVVPSSPRWAERVSVQWRMSVPGRSRRMKLAWSLLNLAEFEPDVYARVLGAAGDRAAALEGFAARALASPALLDDVFARVEAVAVAQPKKYLSRRLGTCFGAPRAYFSCAWHCCPDVTDAVWKDTLAVHVLGARATTTIRLPPPGAHDDA